MKRNLPRLAILVLFVGLPLWLIQRLVGRQPKLLVDWLDDKLMTTTPPTAKCDDCCREDS